MGHTYPRVVFFRDAAGEWRWKVIARNGQIIGTSGEGYKRRIDCVEGADKAFEAMLLNYLK